MWQTFNKVRVIAVYKMIETGKKLTSDEIRIKLEEEYGIFADRKTIISDIRAVDHFIPVKAIEGRNGGYIKHDVLEEAGRYE